MQFRMKYLKHVLFVFRGFQEIDIDIDIIEYHIHYILSLVYA